MCVKVAGKKLGGLKPRKAEATTDGSETIDRVQNDVRMKEQQGERAGQKR